MAAPRQLHEGSIHPRFANAVTAVRGTHTLKALKYDKLLKQGTGASVCSGIRVGSCTKKIRTH